MTESPDSDGVAMIDASDRLHRMMTDLYWFLHGVEFEGERASDRESMDGIVEDCARRWGPACEGPDRINVYMFQSGDVKWRSISRSAEGDYDFEDLIRAASTGDTSYIAGRLLVSSGGDSLTATFPTSATVQQWTRND